MKKIIALVLFIALFLPQGQIFARDSQADFNVKIVTVSDTVSYLTVDGKHLPSKITALALDGREVDFTKVSEDGQIIKREFDGAHSRLTLRLANGDVLTKEIGGLYASFPYKSSAVLGAPDFVWGHVTIPVWDFHTVAKDDEGREITAPQSSTFVIDGKAQPIDAIATPTKASNVITDLTIASHQVARGKDILLSFHLDDRLQAQQYLRLNRIYATTTEKERQRLTFTKKKEGNIGRITISLEENLLLKEAESATLNLHFRGIKSKELQLVFQKAAEETLPTDPNPKEVLTENTRDYGQDIPLTFDLSNPLEKAQYLRLNAISKVYEDHHEEACHYSKTKRGDQGIVTLSFSNSRPIQQRGEQYLKLSFRGLRPLEKTFILKDKAPVIKLNSNNGEYEVDKSLLFTLKGFDYTFQHLTGVQSVYINGVKLERRYVVNPGEDLETLREQGIDAIENEEENPYHVVNDLLRIKNHGLQALREGVNFITVQYDGYHDSTFRFILQGKKAKAPASTPMKTRRARSVDMVTMATGGGPSKPSIGGDGSSGGTVNMGATIVYDFDMVANAKILETLGYQNAGAKRILDYWEGTAKEVAVMKNNPHRKVIWDEYMNFVQDNRLNRGRYYSFQEYFKDPRVAMTENAPYQIKFALPNGLGRPIFHLRELFDYATDEELHIPESVLKKLDHVALRTDIVLPLNEWTANIEKILLNDKTLQRDRDYKVNPSNSELTIFGKVFDQEGNYRLVISSLGYEDLVKDILIQSEKQEDTTIRLRMEAYPHGMPFTGEGLQFEVMDLDSRVTGAALLIDGEWIRELSHGDGYDYVPSLGQLTIHGKEVRKPGEYTVRFYLAGKSFKDVTFSVAGPEIEFVKAPLDGMYRLKGNVASLTLENHTGNRELVRWLDAITSVKVNGKVAPKSSYLNAPLRYEITRDQDQSFDKSAKLYITSNYENLMGKNGKVKMEVQAEGYATVVLEYEVVSFQPVEREQINIYQINPKTGELFQGYSKFDYLEKEEPPAVDPLFDVEEMARKFPGMVFDGGKKTLSNTGEFEKYEDFLEGIVEIQKNGQKISFSPSGVLVDGYYSDHRAIRFYTPLQRGDLITILSKSFDNYEFLVP